MIPAGARRICVVGNSGSGKTTLARGLASSLGVPHVELDALAHRPGWVEAPVAELRAELTALLDAADAREGGWVVCGNYRARVGDLLDARADTVVWLDLPRRVAVGSVMRRSMRRAVLRQPLWNGNRERLRDVLSRDPERSIVAWSWTQHPAYRAQYGEALRTAPVDGPTWIRVSSRRAARALPTA